MKAERITNLLSMAQRAGKCMSGSFAVQKAVAAGEAKLMLIAADTAEATKKEYHKLAANKEIKVFEVLNQDTLGHTLGKEFRTVAVLTDKGFSDAMEKRIMEK